MNRGVHQWRQSVLKEAKLQGCLNYVSENLALQLSKNPNPAIMAQVEGSLSGISGANPLEVSEDLPILNSKRKLLKIKNHEITTRTIKSPRFSYVCLELISDSPAQISLDDLSVRSYLTAAFTQFLGLTGSAISVDILKVADAECWIRVSREDLMAVVAAVGGWVGRIEGDRRVSWIVRGTGNWLGSLVRKRGVEKAWTG
jgi:ribonuclease P/MRP protein subunit POP8